MAPSARTSPAAGPRRPTRGESRVQPTASRVVPVVDYEPPLLRERPAASAAAPRPRPAPPPRPHPTPRRPKRRPPGRRARLRRRGAAPVLEVIDRRRPLAQLRPLLAGGLVDSLLSVPHRHGGEAARLRRIRVQPIGTTGAAAEVAATYTRGRRLHAIACRVQRVDTATRPRLAGGRPAHRLNPRLNQPRRSVFCSLACRRAASRRSRREPPAAAAGFWPPPPPPLRFTSAEPSSAGPLWVNRLESSSSMPLAFSAAGAAGAGLGSAVPGPRPRDPRDPAGSAPGPPPAAAPPRPGR